MMTMGSRGVKARGAMAVPSCLAPIPAGLIPSLQQPILLPRAVYLIKSRATFGGASGQRFRREAHGKIPSLRILSALDR
jgi:hypothetical protein